VARAAARLSRRITHIFMRRGAVAGRAALGGLPVAAAAATRGRAGRSVLRHSAPRTSHDELLKLLRRKAWQLRDLERHPVCLGLPLGQDGGPTKGVSGDCGLKNMATVSLNDLVDCVPELKEALVDRGLADSESTESLPYADLLRRASVVPMSVPVKEDLMDQPIATPVHPRALERCLPDEKLHMLSDPFFRANPPSSELVDLVVEAVPGADRHVAAREEFRREQRAASSARRS
jgi:hypothetical protein